jgi:uncharacterized protein
MVLALAQALSLAAILWSANAQATSFDCAKARSFSEHAACDDPDLAALDDTLADAYSKAYRIAPDQRALAADRDAQWHWRQMHCHDNACVSAWYRRRIGELEADSVPGSSHARTNAREALPALANAEHLRTHKSRMERTDRPANNTASLVAKDETDVVISLMAKGSPLKSAPNRPLPSDAEMEINSVADLELPGSIPVQRNIDAPTSRTLTEQSWPGLPPLPQSGPTNFGIVGKGDRPTRRTIGIQMGF